MRECFHVERSAPAASAAPARRCAPAAHGGYARLRRCAGHLAVGHALIDLVIVAVPAIILYIIAIIFGTFSTALFFLVAFVAWAYSIVAGLYVIGFQNGLGASPGKKVTGLRVISDETGQPIGGGMGIARHFAHIVDSIICYIGWLFPLWDAKRQTIADKIMKTIVINQAL